MDSPEVVVIGSGVSGLAAASHLEQAGLRVVLLEADPEPGGKLRTSVRDGFLIEHGPTMMPRSYRAVLDMADGAGLGDEVVDAGGTFGFVRDGTVHYLNPDRMVRDAVSTRFLSSAGKARAARIVLDCLRHRRALGRGDLAALARFDTESAESYGRRVLGADADHLCGVICRGLEGSSPRDLSKVELWYVFANLLTVPKFFAFRSGMGGFARAVAARFDARYQTRVVSVQALADGVRVTYRSPDAGEQTRDFAGAVIAASADATAAVHEGLDPWSARWLSQVEYSSTISVAAALATKPEHAPAAITLLPEVESPALVCIAMEHNKISGRAPEGKGLMGVYTSGEFAREHAELDDRDCADLVLREVDKIMPGCVDDVEFTEVRRWDQVVVRGRPGHWADLARFTELHAARFPRIKLAGDYLCSGNLGSAANSGARAGQDLVTTLGGNDRVDVRR